MVIPLKQNFNENFIKKLAKSTFIYSFTVTLVRFPAYKRKKNVAKTDIASAFATFLFFVYITALPFSGR